MLERFTGGKTRYLAYFAAALLQRVQTDDVVYHGLAGHFYLTGVSHVLNVRIIADLDDRVNLEMNREGISREEALHIIKKDDNERRQWSLKLFGVDTWDSSLYDLVLHIKKISVDDAVDIICHTAGLDAFKTTSESQKKLDDLVLAARVKAAIVRDYPEADVYASDGAAQVVVSPMLTYRQHAKREIEDLVSRVPDVKELRIDGI
jgi:hypothetical protein